MNIGFDEMSIPSLNYNDATKLFSSVKDQNSYITPSLLTTTHKEESASVELVCSLAKIALEGLKEEVQKKAESPNKLRAQVESVKNYLIKIKDAPKGGDLNDIFLKLFVEADTEIKKIEKLEEFIGEQELKTFPDEKLLAIMSDAIRKYNFEIPLVIKIFRFDFEKYGFKSERTKIRFAKLMADQDGTLISNIIQNFGIKNEAALIEIAQLSAKSNGSGTSEHILNYGITNQRALVSIAKLAAQNDGTGATNNHIKKYGIKDEDDRVEIAKAAALKNALSFVDVIENYAIKNQNALVEIAKLAASVDGSTASYSIQRFKIEKESDRFEIAKIAAQQNGWKTSEYIKEYGILNESALIEIAKISAQESGIGVSFSIQNYNIKSYPARFDIF